MRCKPGRQPIDGVAITGVDITCSDNPPRIGSHFTFMVPLDKSEGLPLDRPEQCIQVRTIKVLSSRTAAVSSVRLALALAVRLV